MHGQLEVSTLGGKKPLLERHLTGAAPPTEVIYLRVAYLQTHPILIPAISILSWYEDANNIYRCHILGKDGVKN